MRETNLRRLLWAGIAASVLDVLLTCYALSGALGVESNPLAAHGMRTVGVGPLVVADLVVRIAVMVVLIAIARAAVRPALRSAAVIAFTSLAVWWTLVVVNNVAALA